MNSLFTLFKSNLSYLVLFHRKFVSLLYLIIFGFLFLPTGVMAEGSKEIYIGTNTTGLYFCNNFITQCDNNGNRTQFAIYDCDSLDRLNFVVNSNDEVVYMGFNGDDGFNWHLVYRIKD
ncbi:MAG TPA: hypothetical protein QF480_06295, partial [Bacteroidales bacterium]|nr:hypothetical protein [Bacteroidales bacterium]